LTTSATAKSAVFGKTTIGANQNGLPMEYVIACRFQAPENGIATQISAYVRGYQSGSVKTAIYSDVNGAVGTLLFESSQINLQSTWSWHNFSANYHIQAEKFYWFAVFPSVQSEFRYDSGLTNQQAAAWGWSYPNVPSTFNGVYGPSYASNADSIYITYTADTQLPDTQPPSYNNVGYNTTLVNSPCLFYSQWQDDSGLSGHIFSTNNTGTWVNDTWVGMSSNPAWANVTKTLSSTGILVIGYRWYCNDTSNNWGNTGTFTLTTVSGDIKPPTYSNIQVNTTVASNPCQFSSYWQDESGLSGFIFSTNNTGTWVNDTYTGFVGLTGWANVTKTLNGTVGNVIGYRWYCNDTSNNWNYTQIQTFTTTVAAQTAVFGKTSIGASTSTLPAGYVVACRFQAPENGIATQISAYIRARYGAGQSEAMIYSDANGQPGRLLFESGQIALSTNWAWYNFSVNCNIQSGQYYWFVIFSSVESQFTFDAGATNQQAAAWGWVFPNVPTNFNGIYGPIYANNADSIYITYSPQAP
jgi:hypothetical protein